MEEEINYSTVVFKNGPKAPKENIEEPTVYSEIKPKGAATTVPDGEADGCSYFHVLVASVGILCVLLVACISAIIYLHVVTKNVMNEQRANLNNITAENEKLIVKKSLLEQEMRNLSRVADNFNRMLGFILKFDTFPVNKYCPEKKCQPCPTDWILFQEKCYMFYNENAPWKTWQESQRYCQTTTADLVVIDNLHEQEFISNHTKYYYSIHHGYWLGLYETADKNWVWVDGRNDTLKYWLTEDHGPYGPFALMIPNRDPTASWDPAEGPMRNKFICENDVFIMST